MDVLADDSLLPAQRAPGPEGPMIVAHSRATGSDQHLRVVAGVVFTVALVAAAIAFVAPRSSRSWYPARWDARIAPIADQVAHIRNLGFEHAVPVRFLTPQQFEQRVAGDSTISPVDRTKLSYEAAQLRALGLMDGTVDLEKALGTAQQSGTLAFYDDARKEIVVRGSVLDVAHRVTLAHELTHVLQDQHLNLPAIQARAARSRVGEGNAFLALIEGDAVHVQDSYVQHLSAADKREYDRENGAEQDRVDKAGARVPDIVQIEMGAPYIYGPETIRFLIAQGGMAAVNHALTDSTPSSVMFLQPGILDPGAPVPTPRVPAGFVPADASERFGAFDLYLMLAGQLDPQRALAAADVTSGGRSIVYRKAGTPGSPLCVRVGLAAARGANGALLADTIRSWAAAVPGATFEATPGTLTFSACDRGRAAKGPSTATMHFAEQLVELRGELTAQFVEAGAPANVARCASRLLARRSELVTPLLQHADTPPTPAERAAIRSAAQADVVTCRLKGSTA